MYGEVERFNDPNWEKMKSEVYTQLFHLGAETVTPQHPINDVCFIDVEQAVKDLIKIKQEKNRAN